MEIKLNQSGIRVIWVVFAVLFGILSLCHFAAAKTAIPPFQRTQRPMEADQTIKISGSTVDQPLDDFVSDFNGYLVKENKASSGAHKLAGWGYLAAALTALFSMALQRQEPCDVGGTP